MAGLTATAVAWHTRHRFLLAFALLSLFMGISVGLAKVTTSLYAIHLGASGWWLGAIAAAQSVGILLTALPMGHWVDRFGPRRLFMAGSLAGGLLYALLPLVPSSGFLLAMTALTGVVMPTRFVSLQMIFMSMLNQIGVTHAGWQRAAHMSGMLLLGPLITAFVIDQVGHAGSYWVVALMFLLTIGLSQSVLRQPLPSSATPPLPAGLRAGLVGLLNHAEARRLAATEAGIQALNMYHAFFIVVIAVQQLHIPAGAAGSLVAIQGAAFIIALLCLGTGVQRLGARAMPTGAVLVGAACLLLRQACDMAGLIGGSALLGLGLGVMEIQVIERMAALGSRLGMGRMASLNAIAGPGGALLGGVLGGSLEPWLGLQNGFLVFAPLFLLHMVPRARPP